jgi:hypothetical protein
VLSSTAIVVACRARRAEPRIARTAMKPSRLFDRLRARRWISLCLAAVLMLAGGVSAVHAAAHGGSGALAFVADDPASANGDGGEATPAHGDCAGCRLSLAWHAWLAPSAPTAAYAAAAAAATRGPRPAALVTHAGTRWQQLRKHGPPAFSC